MSLVNLTPNDGSDTFTILDTDDLSIEEVLRKDLCYYISKSGDNDVIRGIFYLGRLRILTSVPVLDGVYGTKSCVMSIHTHEADYYYNDMHFYYRLTGEYLPVTETEYIMVYTLYVLDCDCFVPLIEDKIHDKDGWVMFVPTADGLKLYGGGRVICDFNDKSYSGYGVRSSTLKARKRLLLV